MLAVGAVRLPLHNAAAALGLGAVILALAVASISSGTTELGPGDVARVLTFGPATEDERFAVLDVRLPRVLMGVMAGFAVAVTGAILQSLARNPLADPGLLGLSQGSLVVIMALIAFAPRVPQVAYPFAALGGGLAVGLLLLALTRGGGQGGAAILLMGIAVETMLSAITGILLLHTPAEVSFQLGSWLQGSLLFSDWPAVRAQALWTLFALAAILALGRRLKAYDLGDEAAMALGEPVALSKPAILIVTVLISSAAVAAVGPLVFLGVLAPQVAMALSPATGAPRLVLSGLAGAAIVVAADMLTRTLNASVYMPIGLTLIAVGAPLFAVTLRLRALRSL